MNEQLKAAIVLAQDKIDGALETKHSSQYAYITVCHDIHANDYKLGGSIRLDGDFTPEQLEIIASEIKKLNDIEGKL